MRIKKRRLAGSKKRLPKLLRARNIIIVSDQAVDHIPLSPKKLALGGTALIAFFCWISYTTGSYMAAESVIAEKDRSILAASMEKKRLGEEMLLMKRDMLKLHQTAADMTDYDKFVVQQYAASSENGGDAKYQVPGALFASDLANGGKSDMLQQRISFLERQVDKLKEDNLNIVMAVYDKTKDKISDYEDVIAMTGLLPETMVKQAYAKPKKEKESEQAANLPREKKEAAGGQGGPFVSAEATTNSAAAAPAPFDPEHFGPKEWEKGLDHLLVLQRVMDVLPLKMPIRGAEMTSSFGRRIDPFRASFAMHTGIDLSASYGAPIYAANDGKVTYAGYYAGYGNMVDVDHGMDISTRYGHLQRFVVRPGQQVKKGQVIAYEGSTGRSTGAHLHYEVRYHDQPINPMKFLKAGQYVLSQKADE